MLNCASQICLELGSGWLVVEKEDSVGRGLRGQYRPTVRYKNKVMGLEGLGFVGLKGKGSMKRTRELFKGGGRNETDCESITYGRTYLWTD